jgi:hypothetical protein
VAISSINTEPSAIRWYPLDLDVGMFSVWVLAYFTLVSSWEIDADTVGRPALLAIVSVVSLATVTPVVAYIAPPSANATIFELKFILFLPYKRKTHSA